ncbi:ABC transporter permease [Azospirillum griseum]|uniref:ABC transporter permease n=1 Tax=Azospirillum griseum TaxID=2496639 RepID=A0A3S0KZ08_9PROT|nr:FtsX-like permease family protein [Azospirillum griseum]RTR21092.1 ABC transporter permease [Azospirillum griseum]
MIWQIATRNLFRNARRSLMTVFAIGISGLAILLFGGFVTSIWFGLQTSIVQEQGHIQIFKRGYQDYGAADPNAYTIDHYPTVIDTILSVPELRSKVAVITPQVMLGGIAGNQREDNSKTFIGKGVVPSDYSRMRRWDSWNLGIRQGDLPLRDDDPEGAIVGIGMARMLGLCDELRMTECKDPPARVLPPSGKGADFSDLIAADLPASQNRDTRPRLDLLAAGSGGAPNIVSVFVNAAQTQATRAVDNAMIMLPFEQARKLLYGDAQRATVVLVQLREPNENQAVKALIAQTLAAKGLDMEVLTFNEVDPTFNRVFAMFSFIFAVVSLVLAVVIVFTIINTVTMNVMERINEVGTVRALGFHRAAVFRQFLAESFLLGLFGATLALVLGVVVSKLLNSVGIQWTPPSNAAPLTIELMVADNLLLLGGTVGFLALVTVVASILPASKAVRIPIVQALHHA